MNIFNIIAGICSMLSFIISLFVVRKVFNINIKLKNIEGSFNTMIIANSNNKNTGISGNSMNNSGIVGNKISG